MAKFHVNTAGNPGRCSAQAGKCPFGADAPHFDSESEARAHYEASQPASAPVLKKEVKLKRWRVMKDVAELNGREFDYSSSLQVANFKLMLARIEHAQSRIGTPSYFNTLREALAYARPLMVSNDGRNEDYDKLSRFIRNSEVALEQADKTSGYVDPVALAESRENQFEKSPTAKQIKESFRSLVESLPDRDTYSSTTPPPAVDAVLQAFTKRSVTPEEFKTLSSDLRLQIMYAGGWKRDGYSNSIEKSNCDSAVKAIYPNGSMFTKRFGEVAWGSSQQYLEGLETMLEDLEEHKK